MRHTRLRGVALMRKHGCAGFAVYPVDLVAMGGMAKHRDARTVRGAARAVGLCEAIEDHAHVLRVYGLRGAGFSVRCALDQVW